MAAGIASPVAGGVLDPNDPQYAAKMAAQIAAGGYGAVVVDPNDPMYAAKAAASAAADLAAGRTVDPLLFWGSSPAARVGGNVIYISNQRTEGNKFGTYHDGGVAASTYLTGIAYSNTLPDYNNFKKLIGTRTNFGAVKEYKLSASASDVAQDDINKPFRILKISNENGIIYLQGDLEGAKNINRFQLASFTSNNFSVAYKYEGTAYNVVIKLN